MASFNLRALSYLLLAGGEAVLAPGRVDGWMDFVTSPPGLGVAGSVALLTGSFVEELGTLRRIRAGPGFSSRGPRSPRSRWSGRSPG